MRAALVEAGQVEEGGPGPLLGPLSPYLLRWSIVSNSMNHLGTVYTTELENYSGYTVPCSTWEAKFKDFI